MKMTSFDSIPKSLFETLHVLSVHLVKEVDSMIKFTFICVIELN